MEIFHQQMLNLEVIGCKKLKSTNFYKHFGLLDVHQKLHTN